MALTNSVTITYGSRSIGGSSSTYQINGPHVVDKSFDKLRVVADVLVVSTSSSALQTASENLEDDFRKRDQNLTISLGGGTWTYTEGTHILNTTASLSKAGNEDTDKGYSRMYTCVIEGTLPAEDEAGLSTLEVTYDFDPGRRRTISMRGIYTAIGSQASSVAQYKANFDGRASTILGAVDPAGTFEIVDEVFTNDRLDAECSFSRQYQQILYPQATLGSLDDDKYVDHRVTFSNQYTLPGEGAEGIFRLRRCAGTFECFLNIEEVAPSTGDMQEEWEDNIRDFIIDQFEAVYDPQVFALEDYRTSFDETAKRMNCSLQILYQPSGGDDVIETQVSVAYRESRNLDLTPVHGQEEYSYIADVGWATRDRTWTRNTTVMGDQAPISRIGTSPTGGGGNNPAGNIPDIAGIGSVDTRHSSGTGQIMNSGWVVTSNNSSVEPVWYGDPEIGDQFQGTMLTEVVTERFFMEPQGGPVTPGGTP